MLRRGRLIDLISSAGAKCVALIAPAGYGKTVLLGQLADEGWLTFDDVHLLDDDEISALANHLDAGTKPVVLAGRTMPARLRAAVNGAVVGRAQLALDMDEQERLFASCGVPPDTQRATSPHLKHGWPTAVHAVAEALRDVNELATTSQRLRSLDRLISKCVTNAIQLSEGQRTAIGVLAGLSRFDENLASTLHPGLDVDFLHHLGIPVDSDHDGHRVAEPFGSALDATDSAPRELIESVVSHLVADDLIHPALDLLLKRGDREGAARNIAGLSRSHEAVLLPNRIHAAMVAIGDAGRVAPRAWCVQARVCVAHGEHGAALAAIERACAAFQEQDPDLRTTEHIEALTLYGIMRSFEGDYVEARRVLTRCEKRLDGTCSAEERALILDLSGVLHHGLGGESDLDRATEDLKESYSIWSSLGEAANAGVTLFRLTAGVLASRGRRAEALRLIDDAMLQMVLPPRKTAQAEFERARLLPYLGRADEVAALCARARANAALLEDRWIEAQCYVPAIIAASVTGDAERVRSLAREVVDDEWFTFDSVGETLHWIDVMEALARTGNVDDARDALRTIERVDGVPEWLVEYSRASFEARCGDAVRAVSVLERLALRDDVETDKRWQIMLLHAFAAHRVGESESAQKLLIASLDECKARGFADLPSTLEASMMRALTGPTPASASALVTISLLGQFRVSINGAEISPPRSRASELVKVLACADGALTVEQVIVRFWPDAATSIGRRRLRNIISRVRDAFGEVVVRSGDSISLVPGTAVDLWEVRKTIAAGLAGDRHQVESALASSAPELLPEDRYSDWAEDARSALTHERIRLFDRLAILAEEAGDRASAIGALEAAVALDPFSSDARESQLRRLRTQAS